MSCTLVVGVACLSSSRCRAFRPCHASEVVIAPRASLSPVAQPLPVPGSRPFRSRIASSLASRSGDPRILGAIPGVSPTSRLNGPFFRLHNCKRCANCMTHVLNQHGQRADYLRQPNLAILNLPRAFETPLRRLDDHPQRALRLADRDRVLKAVLLPGPPEQIAPHECLASLEEHQPCPVAAVKFAVLVQLGAPCRDVAGPKGDEQGCEGVEIVLID